jgi:hypothetical protein
MPPYILWGLYPPDFKIHVITVAAYKERHAQASYDVPGGNEDVTVITMSTNFPVAP